LSFLTTRPIAVGGPTARSGLGLLLGYCHAVGGTVARLGVQVAIAVGGHGSLAGWNFCPKPEPSVTVLQGSGIRDVDAVIRPDCVQATRTEFGRPKSSMRFRAWMATSISVARRWSVRERSPSPITCLNLPIVASTRAREV